MPASRYESLPSTHADAYKDLMVDPAMSKQSSWIAFQDDNDVVAASLSTTPRGSSADASRRPRPSPKKRIKRTTVHRTSSSMPVTLEVLQTNMATSSQVALERVDSQYDYSYTATTTTSTRPMPPPPPPPPPTTLASFPRHVSDDSDPYVMRSDMKRSDRSLTASIKGAIAAPNHDLELFASQQNRTLSTSHSSSGSSNERRSARREEKAITGSAKANPSPSSASVPSQRSSTSTSKKSASNAIATPMVVPIDSSQRRGRPSSRTSNEPKRSATPSSQSRTSARSRSQSQARSANQRATSVQSNSHPQSHRGRSHSSSHRQRPPPTRNNLHMERRSRSRSRSASLTRVVNNGQETAVPSSSGAVSVTAKSVPSRLPTQAHPPRTSRSTYSVSLSGNRRRSASSTSRRGAQSIGPGVSYEAKRKGTVDGISGLEFIFPGDSRSRDTKSTNGRKASHEGAKPPRLSFLGKIFGTGDSQPAKSTVTDPSKYSFRSRTLLAATVYHNTATNLWITTINTNQRGVARDPATANRHLRAFSFTSEKEAREAAIANAPPKMMTEDESHNQCLMCRQPFTIFRRSTHCRNCGVCVCSQPNCSTSWTSKSVPETYNLKNETHVRVCKSCDSLSRKFQAALLDGAYEDAVALYGTGNVNLRTPFPTRSRRDEVMYPVHAAVEGGNIDILRWLVDDHYCPVQVVKAGKPNSSKSAMTSMRTTATTSLTTTGRNRVPILTSKGRSVLSIAMAGARVQILRYLVAECSVSVYESTDLSGCLRSLEAALLFLAPPMGGMQGAPAPLQVMTSPNAYDSKSHHPASTRSGSVRFHDDDGQEDSETEDPSSPALSDDDDDDDNDYDLPSASVFVSSRGDIEEVEVESRRSYHTRGSKSRTSQRSSSKLSTRSAPTTSSSGRRQVLPAQDSRQGTCILCMDRPVDPSGIPCGHEISCSKCHAHLRSCPLCGGPCVPPVPPT